MSSKNVGDKKNNTKDVPKSPYESLNGEEKLEANKKLCGLVENHPQLYNKAHSNYLGRDVTTSTWKAIAASCGDTVDNCKKRLQNERRKLKQWLEKPEKDRKPYELFDYIKFLIPHLNNVDRQIAVGEANIVKSETTDVKNVVTDNKDLAQLAADMQNIKLEQKTPTPKKNTQKPKTTTPKGGTSAVGVANIVKTETTVVKKVVTVRQDLAQPTADMQNMKLDQKTPTPKKNTQKSKTTTPKGGTSAVGVANIVKSETTAKKNIQKPKTTTPKDGNIVNNIVNNYTYMNTP